MAVTVALLEPAVFRRGGGNKKKPPVVNPSAEPEPDLEDMFTYGEGYSFTGMLVSLPAIYKGKSHVLISSKQELSLIRF